MIGGNNNFNTSHEETRGWEIVKQLNASIPQCGNIEARKLLAEYFKLGTSKPSRLHSAILSCAVKMAMIFPEFHFVPFLDIWGIENLRSEDSEAHVDDGKKFPSLVERMTKAYAYSMLFHPDEHLEPELEQMMKPVLSKKGYRMEEKDGALQLTNYALATSVFLSDVRNRKMTFVTLLTPWGEELVTEVHTITQFSRIRYEDITNRLFRVILRTSDNGKLRVEAAIISNENIEDYFATSVGYVEHIDDKHHHIHVYDNESRHMVEKYVSATDIKEGDYVRFVPVIPKEGNFKEAIITSILKEGADAFGYRDVVITYVNEEQGYCAWELMPGGDGKVIPIMETGARSDIEPATKGYISKETLVKGSKFQGEASDFKLPKKRDRLKVIVFLKRGKDGKKKPFVADYIPSPSIS